MIGVREILNSSEAHVSKEVDIEGFLVILDNKIHLIDYQLDEPWQCTPSIELGVADLKYALMLQLAQMVGGDSMFFHEAIISGFWCDTHVSPNMIRSRSTNQEDWKKIDFSAEIIVKGKEKFGHLDELTPGAFEFWQS